jgi:hypothetical protein
VLDAARSQNGREGARSIARPVVGQHALDRDPSLGEEPDRSCHERRSGLLAFIDQDLDVGQARTIIDRGVDEVIARALLHP